MLAYFRVAIFPGTPAAMIAAAMRIETALARRS